MLHNTPQCLQQARGSWCTVLETVVCIQQWCRTVQSATVHTRPGEVDCEIWTEERWWYFCLSNNQFSFWSEISWFILRSLWKLISRQDLTRHRDGTEGGSPAVEGGSPAAHNVVVVYQPRQTLVTPGAQQQWVTTIMVLAATPMSCIDPRKQSVWLDDVTRRVSCYFWNVIFFLFFFSLIYE